MLEDHYRYKWLPTYNYESWWDEIAGHLGAVYPFYNCDSQWKFYLKISDIVSLRKKNALPLEIDTVSIASILSKRYILGDRTLLKGVSRAPWMARLMPEGRWEGFSLPPHQQLRPQRDLFAEKLKEALIEEVIAYIGSAKTVGLLLSGGMDSRIAAAVIKDVQKLTDYSFNVITLTWGMEKTRDVVYARQIARIFNWENIHFPLSRESLAENIEYAGKMGAEVSPFHLHALPQVAAVSGVDVFLAASYGDSVGRGEFSGSHLCKLRPILPKRWNRFSPLKSDFVDSCKPVLVNDVNNATQRFNFSPGTIRQYEIEQEMFYMRRMLQSCMSLVAQQAHFYQIFTAPKVFGMMWALSPMVRDDSWYGDLLSILPGRLLDIPWARSGRIYQGEKSALDNLSRYHHCYGPWFRQEFRSRVEACVHSSFLHGLGIFNVPALKSLINIWTKAKTVSINALDELFSWMLAFEVFIKEYGISIDPNPQQCLFKDQFLSLQGRLEAEIFIRARNALRG